MKSDRALQFLASKVHTYWETNDRHICVEELREFEKEVYAEAYQAACLNCEKIARSEFSDPAWNGLYHSAGKSIEQSLKIHRIEHAIDSMKMALPSKDSAGESEKETYKAVGPAPTAAS